MTWSDEQIRCTLQVVRIARVTLYKGILRTDLFRLRKVSGTIVVVRKVPIVLEV